MPDFLFPKERIINRHIPGAPAPLKVPLYVAKLWSESPHRPRPGTPAQKNTTNTVCVLSLAANHSQDFHFVGPDYCSGSRLVLVPGCPRNKKKHPAIAGMFLFLVALVGLEPTLLAELDFESSASTNSATGPELQKQY